MEALNLSASSVSHFTSTDYSVFGFLLLCSTAIGLYFGFFSKNEQTTEEYLHGGHTMHTFPVAVSLITSMISALTIVALPTEVYSFGWMSSFSYPFALFCVFFAASYLFLPVYFQCGVDNCYKYLGVRFSRTVGNMAIVAWILHVMLYIPIVLYVPSLAFAEVTGHNLHTVNAIACYCCVIYTMLGGMKAVVWTDVVQGVVMMLSMVLVISFGLQKIGGIATAWDRAVDGGRVFAPDFSSVDLTTRNTIYNMFLGPFIIWTSHISFNQSLVQRILSLPSLTQSRRSMFMLVIGVISINAFAFVTGIIMYAYFYGCDPVQAHIIDKADKILPRFVQDVVGHLSGMPGIFISCVFSASLSTVSAYLNSIAGILYMDFIRPLNIIRHTEATANRLMKLIVFLVGSLFFMGVWVVERVPSCFHALSIIEGVTVGTTFGVFSFGMLYPWGNKHGALYGALISMATICFIITNTQIATANCLLKYDPLPTSIEDCDNFNSTLLTELTYKTEIPSKTKSDDEFALYKIAFMWYCPLGALLTWTFGMIISYFTGGNDLEQFDLKLISPAVKWLLPAKYRQTQLQMEEM